MFCFWEMKKEEVGSEYNPLCTLFIEQNLAFASCFFFTVSRTKQANYDFSFIKLIFTPISYPISWKKNICIMVRNRSYNDIIYLALIGQKKRITQKSEPFVLFASFFKKNENERGGDWAESTSKISKFKTDIPPTYKLVPF